MLRSDTAWKRNQSSGLKGRPACTDPGARVAATAKDKGSRRFRCTMFLPGIEHRSLQDLRVVRLRRAHAALRAGQAVTAEAWLRALEAQAPGEVNCLWLLGVALLDQDKIPESIATLERVLASAPDFANARVDLARAYRRDGRAAQ